MVKDGLETVIIPTGSLKSDKERTKSAMRYYHTFQNEKPKIMIVGNIQRGLDDRLIKESQQYAIYKNLRNIYGLQPKNLWIEGESNNTLENSLYLYDKIKDRNVKKISIATSLTHYLRFKLFEKEAKKEELIPQDLKFHWVYTPEPLNEFIRGTLAYVQDSLILKKAGSLENAKLKKQKKER